LVIGLGNTWRGDDGVGVCVAQQVRAQSPQTAVVEQRGEGLSLMECWQGYSDVIVIDAVKACGAAGRLHFFDASSKAIPALQPRTSSHTLSLSDEIELARTLGKLPRVSVYGVEGKCFEVGAPLSAAVQAAIPSVVARVLDQLRSVTHA
jgi:hydrogenase maturation protease